MPRVQFPSFDLRDPVFDAFGFRLSLQIVTLENVLGLDPEQTSARREGRSFVVRAAGLTWAGGCERERGAVIVRVVREGPAGVRVRIKARTRAPIRCVKLLVRDLAAPLSIVDERSERPVGAFGELLSYPNRIPLPFVMLRAGDETLAARVEDDRVREKRFAVALERHGPLAGRGALEVIHEEDAARFGPKLEAPPIVLVRGAAREEAERAQVAFAERALGLRGFEERGDVPAWARELRLVLALHGMHWTGRVFLHYAAMRDVLRFACERIDGRHVLAYLPGWEGRYYWQYGDYRPDPRLGGEAGFAALCEEARRLGAHVMPMFGANCVNAWLPRFADLDPAAAMKSATRNRFHGNQPDWDFARAHDTGWQRWLNPGHPGWRDDLAGQIEGLARRFGFEGVFLDTIHVWVNDADHPVYDGIRALADRLRAALPDVLLAAEHDYDGLLALFPLFQRAYWGEDPAWTGRYALRFAHLCEGEPEGRTGVHEFGVWRTPGAAPPWQGRPGYLPTLAFQDDTLARSREAIEGAIAEIAAAR
jgi:hypothetical protein